MASNKKPRKKYTPRTPAVPMMKETRDRLALSLHMAIEALIEAPSVETYNSLSTKICTLANSGLDTPALKQASAAVQSICDRYERTHKVGLSGDERNALRAVALDLDAQLAGLSVTRLISAEANTAAYCAEHGI